MPTSLYNVVVAFDAYGTLLSTESIADKLATHFGHAKAQTIAATWRKYQSEYTWRLNSMNQYEPFSSVTRNALHHALSEAGESLSEDAVEALLDAYDALSVFADVPRCLRALAFNPTVTPVVFSNGTLDMVSRSVQQSPSLAPLAAVLVLADMVVVDPVRRYKPHPAVYDHLAARDVWLVSGNAFDAVGARAAGMQAAWVDRQGDGWQDRLCGEEWAPTGELPAVLEGASSSSSSSSVEA